MSSEKKRIKDGDAMFNSGECFYIEYSRMLNFRESFIMRGYLYSLK